jgi:hypothetical protein
MRKLFFLIILCCNFGSSLQLLGQGKEISNIHYFNRFIKLNENKISKVENIKKLRIKLVDTLYLEALSKDTAWLKKHKEALYLNFLCYEIQARLSPDFSCCIRQLGFENYNKFYQYRDLKGFPQKEEYENEYELASYFQKEICIKIYLQNNSKISEIPESACACRQVIKTFIEEEDEKLFAAEKAKKDAIQQNIINRQEEIKDSISRLNEMVKYEPIYFSNGSLRADSTHKLKSKNIDSLNIFLSNEMLRASAQVFNFHVNNCASSNVEKMVDALQMQNNEPIYWFVKLKKMNGTFILLDDLPIFGTSASFRLKVVSELFLTKISPYVNENEVVILPFKLYRNSTYTDNRTVENRIADGFIHIILPVIVDDPKDLKPEMSPEEMEWNEENRKRGIKYEE